MSTYKPDDIKNMISDRQIVTLESDYFTDHLGNILNIDEMINQAENDLKYKKQLKKEASCNINLRYEKSKVEQLKKIAAQRGIKYQTLIKNILDKMIESELIEEYPI